MDRIQELGDFYKILEKAERKIGGKKFLQDCNGRMPWPKQGIYFFFEDCEFREDMKAMRVTRVGTHAVSRNSKSTLWQRLRSHRGSKNLRGNHRTSVFRQLIGDSINNRDDLNVPSWNLSDITLEERNQEIELEKKVGVYLGNMPFIYIQAEDRAGIESIRCYIEKNSISLLSNYDRNPIDASSERWLGKYCFSEKVKKSGLWNQNHVESDQWDNRLLEKLNNLVAKMN